MVFGVARQIPVYQADKEGEKSMELSVPERLKDLCVERGLTLEQLTEQTHLSKSALGSYEADEFKDISH